MNRLLEPPTSVEECAEVIASAGYSLHRVDGVNVTFEIVEKDNPSKVVEAFQAALWTELECAQAAVRFARYFFPVNGSH